MDVQTQDAKAGAAPDIRAHLRLCPFCEQNCGTIVEVDHATQEIVGVRGDKDDPLSKGYICTKAYAMKDLHHDPDVLRKPLIRRNGRFEEADWEEALDFAAQGLSKVKAEHGAEAVAAFLGNGAAHLPGVMLYSSALLHALGTTQVYSSASVDQHPQVLANMLMFGSYAHVPVPDFDEADYLVLMGTNPRASNGSLVVAPGIPNRIRAMQKRGGKVVVIDPRKTETAKEADWHLPVRPGADALFLAAVLHEVLAQGGARLGAAEGHIRNLDALKSAVEPFGPGQVAERTGISAEDIKRFAREFCASERAVVHGRVGTTVNPFGSLTHWFMNALNTVSGNLDKPGGAMFPQGLFPQLFYNDPFDGEGNAPMARQRSRVRGAPEIGGQMPMIVLAEEIATPGPGQLKGLVSFAGNPVLSAPNGGGKLAEALEKLEFMVSFDIYLNETSRHADVILPSPDHLCQSDFATFFVPYMVRDYIRYCPPAYDMPEGARADWEIFSGLTGRLLGISVPEADGVQLQVTVELLKATGNRVVAEKSFEQILQHLGGEPGQDRMLDLLLRSGPYGDHFGDKPEGLTLEKLKAHPHGVDYGGMEPRLPGNLKTPDKKIDLAPESLLADLPRLEAEMSSFDPSQLVLIGRRHVRSNNSWMHNLPVLMKGKSRCTLLIHPEDAGKRGVSDGDMVEVGSSAASVKVAAELSEDMRPGVVSLPHGYGHTEDDTRLAVAGRNAGVNINLLAEFERIDVPSWNAAYNGLPVSVRLVT